jgi:glutaredoxin 3
MITVYSTPDCRYCSAAKNLLMERDIPFREVDLYHDAQSMEEFQQHFPHAKTVPQIIINKTKIGGYQELAAMISNENFIELLEKK